MLIDSFFRRFLRAPLGEREMPSQIVRAKAFAFWRYSSNSALRSGESFGSAGLVDPFGSTSLAEALASDFVPADFTSDCFACDDS